MIFSISLNLSEVGSSIFIIYEGKGDTKMEIFIENCRNLSRQTTCT